MPYVDMSEPLVPAPSCRNGCHILREASALSVPLQPGDTRASASGTGSKYGSHAFRFITTTVILRENQEAMSHSIMEQFLTFTLILYIAMLAEE